MWDNTWTTLQTRDLLHVMKWGWSISRLPVTILRGGGVRGPEAGLLVAGVGEVVELVVELRHVGQDGQPVRGRAGRHAAWRGTWHVTRTPGHVAHVQQRGDAQSVLRSLEGELAVPGRRRMLRCWEMCLLFFIAENAAILVTVMKIILLSWDNIRDSGFSFGFCSCSSHLSFVINYCRLVKAWAFILDGSIADTPKCKWRNLKTLYNFCIYTRKCDWYWITQCSHHELHELITTL